MTQNLRQRIDFPVLRRMRAQKHPIVMLTCYDFPMAKILSTSGVHALLVGDSAAMTVLGEDSTVPISLDVMVALTRAVRKGAPELFVMADMPFGSYPDAPTAVTNAARFLKEAGADAVKFEVNGRHREIVAALATSGVPVCAHLGLLPQRAPLQGGYKAQGRTLAEAQRIVEDAVALAEAGAELILLEAVPDEVSAEVVARVGVPVLGCGAGPSCDGHVVVVNDLLGYSEHPPRFVEVMGDVPAAVREAAARFAGAVASRAYPAEKHQYHMMKGQVKASS